jgi:outer membrane immunogenic protein
MRTITAFLAAGLLMGATATVAQAADPVDACSTAWNGFYIGSHIGYVTGDVDTDIGDKNMQGWLGGGLAGYNWQNCSLVLGFEGDVGFGNVDTKKDVNFNDFDMEPNGHLRLRLGYAIDDNIMPFIAGGLAVMDGDLRVPLFPGSVTDSKIHWGFTIGGGLDWQVHENWVWRIEYLYDNYGQETYDVPGPVKVDVDSHTFRTAITYKFNY